MSIDYTSVMRQVAQRRKRALKLRTEGKTLEQIGKALGVSTERARQIIKAAEKDQAAG